MPFRGLSFWKPPYVLYDDRNITANQNPAYNGNYAIAVHLISLNYGYSF